MATNFKPLMEEIEYQGYIINPWVEARMFYVSFDNNKADDFPNGYQYDDLLKYYNAPTELELVEELELRLIERTNSGYSVQRWLENAAKRADYVRFIETLHNGAFPVDVEFLNEMLSNSSKILNHFCFEANKAIPDLFYEPEPGIFKVDKVVLSKFISQPVGSFDVGEQISDFKTIRGLESVYKAYSLVRVLTGKVSKELPKLLTDDGYIKGGFGVFETKTSRNNPLPTKGFLLNNSIEFRSIIRPKPGKAFVKIDITAQEIWIAAVLSGDSNLRAACESGDPYIYTAIKAGFAPEGSTKHTEPKIREDFKQLTISLGYGRTKERLQQILPELVPLYDAHKQVYHVYWDWVENTKANATTNGLIECVDGWLYFLGPTKNKQARNKQIRALMNAPIQSNAAGMMRHIERTLVDTRFEFVANHYDAFYFNCDENEVESCKEWVDNKIKLGFKEFFNVDADINCEPEVFYSNENYYDSRMGNNIQIIRNIINDESIEHHIFKTEPENEFRNALEQLKLKRLNNEAESKLFEITKVDTGITHIPYDMDVIRSESRFIDLSIELSKTGIIFIKSPVGTGKTELLKDVVDFYQGSVTTRISRGLDKNEGILAFLHRVSLVKSMGSRLDIAEYKDNQNQNIKSRNIAYTLDSVFRLHEDINNEYNYSTIIIDEVEQFLKHFLSKSLKERKKCWEAFCYLIRKAERIILLDADLSSELTGFCFRIIRGNRWDTDNFQIIHNEYPIGVGREAYLFGNREQLLEELQSDLLNRKPGENHFIITNIRKQAVQLERFAQNLMGMDYRILLITQDTVKGIDQSMFMSNPSEEQIKWDMIIGSPSINTGISIDGTHFTHKYAFIHKHIFNHYDIVQGLARVRNLEAKQKIWIEQDKSNAITYLDPDYVYPEGIWQHWLDNLNGIINQDFWELYERKFNKKCEIELATLYRLVFNKETKLQSSQLDWASFESMLETLKLVEMEGRRHKFIQYYRNAGYNIIHINPNLEKFKDGEVIDKQFQVDLKLEEMIEIINAQIIDHDEAKRLSKLPNHLLTKEEYRQLSRYHIIDFYYSRGVTFDNLTIDHIKKYRNDGQDQSMRKRVENLRVYGTMSPSQIAQLDDKEHQSIFEKECFTNYEHRTQLKDLLDEAIRSTNLGYNSTNEFINDVKTKPIFLTPKSLDNLVKWANSNDVRLNDLLKIKSSYKYPKSLWDKIFGTILSVSAVSKPTKVAGKSVKYLYASTEGHPLIFIEPNRTYKLPTRKLDDSQNLLILRRKS
jgi:hypothetical protein